MSAKRNGIRVRHARSCPAATEKDAACKCKPSYEAFVYSARERKKIRQSFPTLAAAKAWRDDSNVGVRKGTLRTPTRATLRETAETLIEVAPKSAAGVRKVPVPATLPVHLDSHLERDQRDADALLFGRTAFDPFTDTHMRAKAQEAWTAAGLAKIGFHECRHSYSSMLSAAGVDQTRADWYLGHADHSTPGRYRHPLPGQLAKDAETLDAYLVGATSGKVVRLRTGAHTGAHAPQTRMAAAK